MPFLFGTRKLFRAPTSQKPPLLFPASELPGRYTDGNESLILDVRHTFEYTDSNFTVRTKNRDKWKLDGDRLILERRLTGDGPPFMSARFIPVKWERRIYLVEELRMPYFCYGASRFRPDVSYRGSGIELLKLPPGKPRVADIEKAYPPLSPKSHPLLPERYRTFYEQGPIHARVVKILPRIQRGDIPKDSVWALLDRGTADRIKPGLLLSFRWPNGGWNWFASLIVVTARANEAEAVYLEMGGCDGNMVFVGSQFSSGEGYSWPCVTGAGLPSWAEKLHESWNG